MITITGEPGAYSPGIHAFDRDGDGTLYIFSQNQVIKDPGARRMFSSTHRVRQFHNGVRGKFDRNRPFGSLRRRARLPSLPRPRLRAIPAFLPSPAISAPSTANHKCFSLQIRESARIKSITGTRSGHHRRDGRVFRPDRLPGDNLYYGFRLSWFILPPQVADLVGGSPVFSDWTVLASGVDACSGLVLDENGEQNLYSAHDHPDRRRRISALGGGEPSILSFSGRTAFNPGGGRLSILSTDWLDYSSTVFAVAAGRILFSTAGIMTAPAGVISRSSVRPPASGRFEGVSRIYFGGLNDLPVAGDYNADGTAEIFRPSTGLWAIRGVTETKMTSRFPGTMTGMKPGTRLPAGDRSPIRDQTRIYLGQEGDYVPAEYGGAIGGSSAHRSPIGLTRFYYPGAGGDAGDRRERSADLWAVRGLSRIYFGTGSDIPLPLDINPSTAGDIGIFRPSTGLWAIRGFTRAYYGGGGDYPVSR